MGVSSVNLSDRLISGRPYGGLAILYKKELAHTVKVLETDDPRLLAIEIEQDNHGSLVILNVYLPYDTPSNYDEYMYYLDKIKSFINACDSPLVYVIGDFNANLSNSSCFGNELVQFCQSNSLSLRDREICSGGMYTYVSDSHGSTSWLDHCVCTESGRESVTSVKVLHNYVGSDHLPILCTLNKQITPGSAVPNTNVHKWERLSDDTICKYQRLVPTLLSEIVMPTETLSCSDAQCDNPVHREGIASLYDNIIATLNKAIDICIPKGSVMTNCMVPGWNDYVKHKHSQARDAYLMWRNCSKPRHGYEFEQMQATRAQFKYALRQCVANEEQIKSDNLASALGNKDMCSFWKDVKHISKNRCSVVNTVGGCTGEENVADMWRIHFNSLLNSVTQTSQKSVVMAAIRNVTFSADMNINAQSLNNIIQQLDVGKAAGPDGLPAEALQLAGLLILSTKFKQR